jgi:hypothetical protein
MTSHTEPTANGITALCVGTPDPERVIWSDGTGRAACGSSETHGAHLYQRAPEWVRRAQANQLVRKDMTGTVAA